MITTGVYCRPSCPSRHAKAENLRFFDNAAQARADVMIPVVKAWGTELGVDIANTGIQVHGGMGFVEETGAAQYLRDARIAPIYEGTNGIQAIDLVGRKLIRDEGRGMRALIADIRATADGSAEGANAHPALAEALDAGLNPCGDCLP